MQLCVRRKPLVATSRSGAEVGWPSRRRGLARASSDADAESFSTEWEKAFPKLTTLYIEPPWNPDEVVMVLEVCVSNGVVSGDNLMFPVAHDCQPRNSPAAINDPLLHPSGTLSRRNDRGL